MEAAILLGLIVLNGLFAMSEVALLTARKARLQRLVAEGDKSAAAALALGEDPTRFLSTIQIGITSIGVLNGIVGQAAFAEPLARWLLTLGVAQKTAEMLATTLVVVLVTYVAIVVGELVPKRLGQISAETVARLAARPMGVRDGAYRRHQPDPAQHGRRSGHRTEGDGRGNPRAAGRRLRIRGHRAERTRHGT